MKVMADGYTRFGEVFTVPLLHKNLTFLIGPSVTPHFFKATDDEMSQTEVCTACICPTLDWLFGSKSPQAVLMLMFLYLVTSMSTLGVMACAHMAYQTAPYLTVISRVEADIARSLALPKMFSSFRACAAQVYKFNVPTFGPGVVFDVDIKIRTEQIRFFTESLKTSKLQSYVPQFVMEAEVRLELDFNPSPDQTLPLAPNVAECGCTLLYSDWRWAKLGHAMQRFWSCKDA